MPTDDPARLTDGDVAAHLARWFRLNTDPYDHQWGSASDFIELAAELLIDAGHSIDPPTVCELVDCQVCGAHAAAVDGFCAACGAEQFPVERAVMTPTPPDDDTIRQAHAFADRRGEDVAVIPVPDGPLRAVFGRWLLRPFSDREFGPGVAAEWDSAPYVAHPDERAS